MIRQFNNLGFEFRKNKMNPRSELPSTNNPRPPPPTYLVV